MSVVKLFRPYVAQNAGRHLDEDVISTGYITQGPRVEEFERKLASEVCSTHAHNVVTVNSCTTALSMVYRYVGVGLGDVVVATPMTCFATVSPVLELGACLAWTDIDPSTGNVTPETLDATLEDLRRRGMRAKAATVLHWGGNPVDIDGLVDVANRFDVPLVLDAAHAVGTTYKGRPATTSRPTVYSCLSFQAVKHLTTVDGGAIVAPDYEAAEHFRLARWFGFDRRLGGFRYTEPQVVGGKYHMNDVNAYFGLRNLTGLADRVAEHVRRSRLYSSVDNDVLTHAVALAEGSTSSCWLHTVLLPDERYRDRFAKHMWSRDIEVERVHVRVDTYEVCRCRCVNPDTHLPGVTKFDSTMLCVPNGWHLTAADEARVVDALEAFR